MVSRSENPHAPRKEKANIVVRGLDRLESIIEWYVEDRFVPATIRVFYFWNFKRGRAQVDEYLEDIRTSRIICANEKKLE